MEKEDGGTVPPGKPKAVPRINGKQFYHLASPELRMHIDVAGGGNPGDNPTYYAIETGCWTRMSEIRTNITAWGGALACLGVDGANMIALVTDARLSDPKLPPVVSPGGYFRSMVKAYQSGDLNIVGSFMGLVARRAMEEEAELLKDLE